MGGHQRYKVLVELGFTDIDSVVVDVDSTQEKALNVALNKITGEFDIPLLTELLQDLSSDPDFDLTLTGFDLNEIDGLFDDISEGISSEDDFDAEAVIEENPISKLGDIWLLGRHRLMCGDSTKRADVERLIDGTKADMVFTDPPYGVNVKGAKGNIEGDLTQVAIPFSFEWAVEVATKDKARFYFCGGEGNLAMYEKLFDRYLHQLPKHLVWVKENFVIKQLGYHTKYELIFYGYKQGGGGADFWFSERTDENASDVWRINRDAAVNYLHPTQKPIEIPSRAIRNSTPKGAIIYDPFGGSGSTLIACEQLDRICYMMELDPKYCDVIVKRYIALADTNEEGVFLLRDGNKIPYAEVEVV